ncbi:MAG: MFS transporter [Desulfobacterales bacterium]|jgi:YNFM family putative membrane transporter|nr:MFS transporter [Desulfobacterales bacterium]
MPAHRIGFFGLQALVFTLVSAAFTAIYLTQPVLPVIRQEFGVDEKRASLTVSAVILGIALSNLPFGRLSDRTRIKPLIAVGGAVVAVFGLFVALTHDIALLVAFRFVQGLFIPALTTCLAAYLARSLPADRLSVVMGSYVAATVVGGLMGRLIGGFIHPPLNWRYAFVSVSALVAAATLAALRWLPREASERPEPDQGVGFLCLLARPDLLRIYAVAFCAFFVFSGLFNYLPFYLSGPPFGFSTNFVTFMYLAYLIGVVVAPLSGRVSNRLGSGATLCVGAAVFAAALVATRIPSAWAVGAGLCGVCAGFFTVHAAAVGALNRRLSSSRGRANALYILFYYLGGSAGITLSGFAYQRCGWAGVVGLGLMLLALIAGAGIAEVRGRARCA